MSPKPTSGESARFHLSDYRLVARHNFRLARHPGTTSKVTGGLVRLGRVLHSPLLGGDVENNYVRLVPTVGVTSPASVSSW
jgi:hypothetical protein